MAVMHSSLTSAANHYATIHHSIMGDLMLISNIRSLYIDNSTAYIRRVFLEAAAAAVMVVVVVVVAAVAVQSYT
ncbi:hypothetical protein E2C01_087343 [Portunus trituberculatus]|uniref:Uncharacterized protein n=1 Tax=Portunus trituberculatus TaxID=210409 RepID=A0A5B7JIZ4_PORTR|nr:hypothetical protein [Portunus trituberculatus]